VLGLRSQENLFALSPQLFPQNLARY